MQIIFVNPHIHHSYFTCLALSRLGSVHIICPPLLLQLWLGGWKRDGIRSGRSFTGTLFAIPIALLGYVLYKSRIFSETSYCQLLGIAAHLLATRKKQSLIFVYQDYMLPLLAANKTNLVVVEMINRLASPTQPNYTTSLEALKSASVILAPCNQILADLSNEAYNTASAPYGGNKGVYRIRGDHSVVTHAYPTETLTYITIAARASSFMKGIDILLGALALLRKGAVVDNVALTVLICGHVADQVYLRQIASLNQGGTGLALSIKSGQLSQDSYLNLLRQADLFVMPSRLESMSLAATEALWMCLPSLLSPYCGVDQFNKKDHGRIIDPNTPENLAFILSEIIAHPQILLAWREQLEKDRGLFSWDVYLDNVSKAVATVFE
jgi:glycosyltransferase involved in cell wall biosynthesis